MHHTCTNCGHADEINAASIMGAAKSPKKAEAVRKNGAAPIKPGSRPRGRPKKSRSAGSPVNDPK